MTDTGGNGTTEDLWVEQDGAVLLRGMRCNACGGLFFPPQQYGCEACGADQTHLGEELLPSTGTLHSFTTVYVHHKLKTPYQVAEVQTRATQRVRGRLEHPDPRIGEVVTGSIQTVDGDPQFAFVPHSGSEG